MQLLASHMVSKTTTIYHQQRLFGGQAAGFVFAARKVGCRERLLWALKCADMLVTARSAKDGCLTLQAFLVDTSIFQSGRSNGREESVALPSPVRFAAVSDGTLSRNTIK